MIEFVRGAWTADHLDAHRLEHGVERGGEAGIAVMQHELHPSPDVFQVQEQVPGLLNYPRLDRCSVAPRTRIRRVPCSITART